MEIQTQEDFENILQCIREQCFHMNDKEATLIVDSFIEKYPELLNFNTREWLIRNS
jgi:hypothetical protein